MSHSYEVALTWTGNRGPGTPGYQGYDRSFTVFIHGKPDLLGSSDPSFIGDPTRHNPEELLVASLSSCHMLWYLHLCSDHGISVLEYTDEATGTMTEAEGFTEVSLNPSVVVSGQESLALTLHQEANRLCFIAKSVRFPITHNPTVRSNN